MDIEKVKKQLRPIGETVADYSAVDSYLRFYGLDLANETIEHRFGTFKSGEFTLCGHIFIPLETSCSWRPSGINDALSLTGFKPKDYKATVIIVHGYTAHCGLLNKIIKELLGCGFAVCCFDLPGHGLSSGERTAIDNFSQYSDCLADFVNVIRPYVKAPYHLIGHSAGGAIVMDYLLSGTSTPLSTGTSTPLSTGTSTPLSTGTSTPLSTGREDCFGKVVLAAPLVRSCNWKMSKLGFAIFRRFCQKLPRIYRKISSDKDFLKFLKYQDSLSARNFSLKWVGAMFEWSERIAENDPAKVLAGLIDDKPAGQACGLTRPILIIQGTKDNIVDWRYNVPIIMSKFRDCEVELIENGRHELFNESQRYRDEVFSLIKEYLRR